MRITIIGTAGSAWWIGTKPNPDPDDPKGSTIAQGRFEKNHVQASITIPRTYRRVLVRIRSGQRKLTKQGDLPAGEMLAKWFDGPSTSYLVYPIHTDYGDYTWEVDDGIQGTPV